MRAELVDRYRHGVLVGLKEVPAAVSSKQPPARVLLEVLRDRQDDILRFIDDPNVPPTSNQAERDLRPAKTQQKISGRLRSQTATAHRYRIHGYISTAKQHGIKILDVIRDALISRPWMPPDPAPA